MCTVLHLHCPAALLLRCFAEPWGNPCSWYEEAPGLPPLANAHTHTAGSPPSFLCVHRYIKQISRVLNLVPRQMLLLFKATQTERNIQTAILGS